MARNLGVPYTDEKPYYFISYNSEDESRVTKYAKVLSEFNIPLWYDNGLKVGEEWEVEIADKIDNCHAVIMFLSKKIFEKENSYVHKEFELAREYSMKKVYVMMLDKIAKPDVPVRFRGWWTSVCRLHCINTYEYAASEECVKKLLESMESSLSELPSVNDISDEFLPKGDIQKDIDYEKYALKFWMCAHTYDLELNDNIINFSKWLFRNIKDKDASYKYIKGFISLSSFIKGIKLYQIPLYHTCDVDILRDICNKSEANDIFREKDIRMDKLYSKVMELYCQFASENVKTAK